MREIEDGAGGLAGLAGGVDEGLIAGGVLHLAIGADERLGSKAELAEAELAETGCGWAGCRGVEPDRCRG